MKFYSDWALRILGGHWTDGQAFYGLPGYAFFLAGIYALTGFNPYVVGLLQAGSEAMISVLIYKIATAVFANEKTNLRKAGVIGGVAALGWTFLQPAQAFSVVLMPTTWLVLAFWGCVYWIIKAEPSSAWRPWLWMGLLFGAVAMMIATVLFLIPLAIAGIWIKAGRGAPFSGRLRRLAIGVAVLLAGVFAGASPCFFHNYLIAGERVMLSAHSGVNFYIGNNPIANGYPKIPPGLRAGQAGMLADSITMAEAAAGHRLKRVEVSEFWSAKAREYIHSHPLEWMRLLGIKFRNFWNTYQYDDLSLITLFREDGIVPPGLRFGWVAAFGLPGILLGWWKAPKSRWITAAIFLHMLALMPVFVTERYRLAAAPGLLMMGSFGLVEFWQSLVEGRWRSALSYFAGAMSAAAFVAWPQSDPGLWSLDYYNTGWKATLSGDFDRAQRNLEMAYAFVPDNAEINFALGNLWLAKNDRVRAKKFYRRALDLNPRHAGAFNNLGVMAIEESRWDVAERFFLRSLEIEPEDAKTNFLLARARFHAGDRTGALDAVEKAIALEPERPEFTALREEITNSP